MPPDKHPGGAHRTSVPLGRASGRDPQDLRVPGMGIWAGPPGPLRPRDRHPGGAPRTAAPLGRAFGRGPQDLHVPGMGIREGLPGLPQPQDGHPGGAPRTTTTPARREAAQVAVSALQLRHSS